MDLGHLQDGAVLVLLDLVKVVLDQQAEEVSLAPQPHTGAVLVQPSLQEVALDLQHLTEVDHTRVALNLPRRVHLVRLDPNGVDHGQPVRIAVTGQVLQILNAVDQHHVAESPD